MRTFLPVIMLCTAMHSGFGQAKVIEFTNPSFEDFARAGLTPIHWYNCGFLHESPPYVQPHAAFGVTTKAHDGNTYLSMIVRENNTWEAISEKQRQSGIYCS